MEQQDTKNIIQKRTVDEKELGIELFIGNVEHTFRGTIKSRYSDFTVHEIDRDGRVAKLTNLEAPNDELDDDSQEDKIDLEKLVDQATIDSLDGVQRGYLNEKKIDVTGLSKETRTSIHQAIRSNYDKLESITVIESEQKKKKQNQNDETESTDEKTSQDETGLSADNKIHILVRKKSRSSRATNTWPRQRPNFTKFILYKENKDTMDAIRCLAQATNSKPSNFSLAGVKDKRAITSQWITCWKLEPKKLIASMRRFNRHPIIKVGNFEFTKEPLKLGQLKGNKFCIAIRNLICTNDTKLIEESMSSIKEFGFVNYFGLQRFGTRSIQTHEIGIRILQERWEDAVELILSYKNEDHPSNLNQNSNNEKNRFGDNKKMKFSTSQEHNAFIDFWKLKKDAILLFQKFPSFRFTIEGMIISSLAKSKSNEKNYHNAIITLPRNSRSMYVHSYQSYLWNKLVTYRLKNFGFEPILGDLVLGACLEEEDYLCDTLDEQLVSIEKSSQNDKNEDQTRGETLIKYEQNKNVIKVDEINKSKFSIYDVVLPLVGSEVLLPENMVGDKLKEMLKEDNLTVEDFKVREKNFLSFGSYRKIITKPKNVEWHSTMCTSSSQDLIETDLDHLKKSGDDLLPEKSKVDNVNDDNFSAQALIVGFELPSSSYATMCLREIMKIPSTELTI